jgi:hypothetical protein
MQNGTIELSYYPISVFNRHIRERKWSMKQHLKWMPCIFPYTDHQSEENREKLFKLLPTTDDWIFNPLYNQ